MSSAPGEPHPVLRLSSVSKVYAGDPAVTALRDVSLEVATGQMLAVVGRSGSGKSTLLNILGLLDTPSSGSYEILGRDVVGMSRKKMDQLRSSLFGMVFQAFHLVPYLTAEENVALGLTYGSPRPHKAAVVEARRVLERVGLSGRAAAEVTRLSGGERQRVAIARALVANPQVVLADEPTGNLDEATANQVMGLLHGVCAEGVSVVLVTHDAESVRSAHAIVRISDGKAHFDAGSDVDERMVSDGERGSM